MNQLEVERAKKTELERQVQQFEEEKRTSKQAEQIAEKCEDSVRDMLGLKKSKKKKNTSSSSDSSGKKKSSGSKKSGFSFRNLLRRGLRKHDTDSTDDGKFSLQKLLSKSSKCFSGIVTHHARDQATLSLFT